LNLLFNGLFHLFSNVRNLPETVSRLSDDPYITADDNSSSQSLKQKRISIDNKPSLAAHSESQLVETKPIPIRNDGSLDYDALYDDDDESNISMESHGSVVTHLLSQVKIGMDLTKVVLPTFILERRSLLEMYADYFAHPDLFLK
jgi:oxysterol-binding protein-related protein 9/10/11